MDATWVSGSHRPYLKQEKQMYTVHKDFHPWHEVDEKKLDEVLYGRMLDLSGLDRPLVIKKIEYLYNNGFYLVRTTTEDGHVGVAVPTKRIYLAESLLYRCVAPYFIGKDARDIEALVDGVYVWKSNYKLAGLPFFIALSAIETSILDLLGKARGVTVGELFGKRIKERVNIYYASGNRQTTPEEELEILARKVAECGARAIKFKIGGRMSRNADSIANRSEELIRLTREYFGPDMIIHADGNGSYDVQTALRYARILEEINAYFYEEPCPFDDLDSTREVTVNCTIPLAFGEQETSLNRFKWLVKNHGCDVIQPDILYNGGLIRTTRVARMAELAGMSVTPHVSDGFGFIYILHFSSYTPNIGNYQEMKTGLKETNEFLDGHIVLKDGKLNIPTLPGFGIREDHPLVRKAVLLREFH